MKQYASYVCQPVTMGSEQKFNSLNAQRDSALVYLQRQTGWKLVGEH